MSRNRPVWTTGRPVCGSVTVSPGRRGPPVSWRYSQDTPPTAESSTTTAIVTLVRTPMLGHGAHSRSQPPQVHVDVCVTIRRGPVGRSRVRGPVATTTASALDPGSEGSAVPGLRGGQAGDQAALDGRDRQAHDALAAGVAALLLEREAVGAV